MLDSKTSRTYTPQAGIFAVGTSSHAHLEFDLANSNKIEDLVSAIAAIRKPRTTTGGVNLSLDFSPSFGKPSSQRSPLKT
jgi:putative iron-dependent peroxidase